MTRSAALVLTAVLLQTTAAIKVIDWEKLTEQQFKQLPAGQRITFGGKQTTLGELRPKVTARMQQVAAERQTSGRRSALGARPSIDRLLRQQNTQLSSLQASIGAGMKKLRQQKTAVSPGAPAVPYDTHLPTITNVFAILQPGGAVLIDGHNFGNAAGHVRLIAQDNSWTLELGKLEWFAGGIGGVLPTNAKVSGLAAKFVVEVASGGKSNPWPVNWIQDVKMLPFDDVAVTSCSLDSNHDHCNNAINFDDEFCAKTVQLPKNSEINDKFVNKEPGPRSITGFHKNCWGAFGTDKGTDVYQVNLKNGWVLHDLEFQAVINDPGGSAEKPGGFTPGASSWTASVEWFVQPAIGVLYSAIIYIRGPKGISHK